MRTIRGRLAVSYGIALAVTLFVFAATIYLIQSAENFGQLDARAQLESDLIAEIIGEAWETRAAPVVVEDPVTGTAELNQSIASLLQSVQDYVLVLDTAGTILYSSEKARELPSAAHFERLADLAKGPNLEEGFGVIDLGSPIGRLRYHVRPITNAGPRVASIVSAALPATGVLGAQRLLFGMLVSGVLILIASTMVGYFLAGKNLQPMDTIIDEIEAITDGRSLHKRVIEVKSTEELARLTTTLNGMLVRLERSFISLRRFTADASHELKTPLTVLRSGTEQVITHPKAPPEVLEVLEETLIEINRMTELVDSLLILARSDEGRAPLHLEKVDLKELMGEIAETASMLGEQSILNVTVSGPQRTAYVAMDRHRVRQLLMNLLTNAIKYTPRGGRVAVECRLTNGRVLFRVADSGVGIAAGDLPHIFDRFWRADAARSRTGERPGAGLGLAICKWIAEAHGGSIDAQSRAGRGTTITVNIPKTD
jgi:heavy metal sensor kinase